MGGRGGRGRGGGPGAPTELSVLYCALREAVVNVGQDKFGQLLLICSGGDKMASMPGENVAIRRQNSLRRSLRTTPHRTYSVIVTEKERTLLRESVSPPQASASSGFVKNMTRFYNGVFTESYHRHRLLSRAASFASPAHKAAAEPPPSGSKPRPLELRGQSPLELLEESSSPQLSPSVKSQDSGFSDSGGESPPLNNNIKEDSASSGEVEYRSYSLTSEAAGERLQRSLGQVSSLQAGLRLKLEDEPRSLLRRQQVEEARRSFQRDCSSAGKLIHYINTRNRERVKEARARNNSSQQEEEDKEIRLPISASPLSCSTPLRSSAMKRRPERPCTITDLPETGRPASQAPDASRIWLKDVKRRRRWSQQLASPPSPRPLSPLAADPSDLSAVGCFGELSLTIIQHEEEDGLQSEVTATPPDQQLLLRGQVEAASSRNSSCTEPSPDPVYEWWTELLGHTEPECMTYLQSKPILRPGVEISGAGSGQDSRHNSYRHKIRHLLDSHQNIQHTLKVFKR